MTIETVYSRTTFWGIFETRKITRTLDENTPTNDFPITVTTTNRHRVRSWPHKPKVSKQEDHQITAHIINPHVAVKQPCKVPYCNEYGREPVTVFAGQINQDPALSKIMQWRP